MFWLRELPLPCVPRNPFGILAYWLIGSFWSTPMAKFHEGERAVQQRAGVADMAARVGQSIHPAIPPRAGAFVSEQPFVVLASRSAAGRAWASVMVGEPGFVRAPDERTLEIAATPAAGDPLRRTSPSAPPSVRWSSIRADPPAPARQRRRRAGRGPFASPSASASRTARSISSSASCGRRRRPAAAIRASPRRCRSPSRSGSRGADTFFIASQHARAGLDASHRGGNPGFVDVVDAGHLAWPDYVATRCSRRSAI